MKLFTVADLASKKEAQTVADIRRLQTVSKELLQSHQSLNKLEADFALTMEKQREQWTEENNTQTAIGDALRHEVMRLEERKQQALIPLEQRAQELDNRDKELSQWESELAQKTDSLTDEAELLQEKLSAVAERESHAKKIGRELQLASDGIVAQKAQIALQAHELGKEITSAIQADIERQNAVERREIAMNLKEGGMIAREERLALLDQDLSMREDRLKDRYLMLERTTQELHDRRSTRQQPKPRTPRHSPK